MHYPSCIIELGSWIQIRAHTTLYGFVGGIGFQIYHELNEGIDEKNWEISYMVCQPYFELGLQDINIIYIKSKFEIFVK